MNAIGTPTESGLIYNTSTGFYTGYTGAAWVALANLSGVQTLTNKAMSGSSNTFSNIGYSSLSLAGSIVNADISASAAIVDTKLATISTASKVSNSATTATNANTASAIVARDGSGNFIAGTITAALTGVASGNTTYTPNNHGIVISGSGNTMTVLAPDASTSKVLTSGGSSADPTWQTPSAPAAGCTVQTKSANYAAVAGDCISVSASGAWTLTLPTAVGISGQTISATRSDNSLANAISVNTTSSQTIGSFGTSVHIITQAESWTWQSDGANWVVTQHLSVTPWATYTPTIGAVTTPPTTTGTGTTIFAEWMRDHNNVLVHYYVNVPNPSSGNSSGSGNYKYPLPANITANSSALTINTNFSIPWGSQVAASAVYFGGSTGNLSIYLFDTSNMKLNINGVGPYSSTNGGFSAASLSSYSFIATIPATNWEP